jgi:hypothetical protein
MRSTPSQPSDAILAHNLPPGFVGDGKPVEDLGDDRLDAAAGSGVGPPAVRKVLRAGGGRGV